MIFLIAGISAYILLLVLVWAICRAAGLTDEAMEREFGPRRTPPRGWD